MTDLSKIAHQVGFIGAGNMAGALIRGMVKAGLPPGQVHVTDIRPEPTQALSDECGISPAADAQAVADTADIVLLAVKPGTVTPLLKSLKTKKSTLWISVAAGVSCNEIETALGLHGRVIRCMPNTPALVGEGATGLCRGAHASDDDLQVATSLLQAVGITEVVAESMMDAVTGVAGSAPAYVMLMIEAMADGAVRAGLPRHSALKMASQTIRGAATMALATGKHPGELKDMVTSPGGTTIAAVSALESAGFRSALIDAVTAAAEKSASLSKK